MTTYLKIIVGHMSLAILQYAFPFKFSYGTIAVIGGGIRCVKLADLSRF